MDVNIDPDIDPAIGNQSGIFTKYSITSDYTDSASHPNAFIDHPQSSTSYTNFTTIDDEQDPDTNNSVTADSGESDASAAAAAAVAAAAAANLSNIINFNQLQQSNDESTSPSKHQGTRGSHDNGNSGGNEPNNADSLRFLHNALELENVTSRKGINSNNGLSSSQAQPKQQLIHDSNSQVSIIMVNPGSGDGTSRLGRPRKHVSSNSTDVQSSAKNQDESVLSTFRLDAKPMTGPGSRGGRKNKGGVIRAPPAPKPTAKELRPLIPLLPSKRKVQQLLNFSTIQKRPNPEAAQSSSPTEQKPRDEVRITLSNPHSNPNPARTIILEDSNSLLQKGRSTAREIRPKPSASGYVSTNSVLSSSKRRRQIPGPLVALYDDLYLPSAIETDGEGLSKVALGFNVKPAPYAKDIIFILSFFVKFNPLFQDFPNLGPQDIEFGLKLEPQPEYPLDNVNQIAMEPSYKVKRHDPEISDLMELFFFRLLSLVLNRKKQVSKSGLKKALIDLKSRVLAFGLPSEWRDDSAIFDVKENDLVSIQEDEPVDPSNDELFDIELPKSYGKTKPLAHTPLDNEEFEERGLEALKPTDRLILLRSLIQWSLSHSELVREELNTRINKQDATSEKETSYVSRFVKEGEAGVELSTRVAKSLPKRKAKRPTPPSSSSTVPGETTSTTPDPYTDASANPLEHHLSFRLIDFFAGEGGPYGRFFLVRSADSKTGGFSTMSELKSLSSKSIHDLLSYNQPSRFKLYAQDLCTTLATTDTSVVPNSYRDTIIEPWYEIASNVEELKEFMDFIDEKLPQIKNNHISKFLEYLELLLPPLEKFEEIHQKYLPAFVNKKSRRKQITDLKAQDREFKKMIDKNEDEFNEGDYLEDESDGDNDNDNEDDGGSDSDDFDGGDDDADEDY